MIAVHDRIETDQIARQVEACNLLVALFSNGVALDRAGADSVERFQIVACFKQRLAFLNRFFTLDNVVELIQLMFIQGERDTQLTNAAVLTVDGTATRLNTANGAFSVIIMYARRLLTGVNFIIFPAEMNSSEQF